MDRLGCLHACRGFPPFSVRVGATRGEKTTARVLREKPQRYNPACDSQGNQDPAESVPKLGTGERCKDLSPGSISQKGMLKEGFLLRLVPTVIVL